jgi:alkanesulfonate monooxygenase SsuD/methylene tetrahydromethanopterin reductase-like flavin-dependent oxidoreductase (luciferase family)
VRAALAEGRQRPQPVQSPLPIWVGGSSKPAMRRAAARGDGWLPQGPPEGGMAAGIDFVRAHRAETRGDEPITIGALSGPLHLTNADKVAAYLRSYRELGCDQVQVGFKSTSADDLCDQIARFAADIAPLVND